MKKSLAIFLAVIMLIGLVACGPPTPDKPDKTTLEGDEPSGTTAPEGTTAGPFKSNDPNYGTIIIGSNTEISGDWGRALWTNNATDAMIRDLIDAYGTVMSNKDAVYVTNPVVVEKYETEEVDRGGEGQNTKIFKIKIKEDLTYNNGDPMTAKDFVAATLFACSKSLGELKGKSTAFKQIYGGEAYNKGEATKVEGIRLLGDYEFSLEINADYLPYYYDITYAGVSPMHYKRWFGEDVDILDDGEGCYFNEAFTTENIKDKVEAERFHSDNRVSAGPYTLESFDASAKQATLVKNDKYAGNIYGVKPEVEKIVVIKAEEATWADGLKTNVFNVYDQITGGDDINKALEVVKEKGMQYAQFQRAGYGKLLFQCDFGPTQFIEVRHAIAYLLDRPEFAKAFCKGWGGLVHGPYGIAQWMYKESEEWIEDNVNKYNASLDSAVKVLEDGGWTLNDKGEAYTGEGLRHKKVTEEEAGQYQHNVKLADGTILMPLTIEWLSTEKNEVSELLKVMLAEQENTAKAGMQINRTEVDFTQLLNYMYRDSSKGDQYGVPTYGMYNLATNFYPAYDMSYSWTRDPELLPLGYNVNFLMDEELDNLSMDMVYGVPAGDDAKYLEIWQKYIKRWNEMLPEVPLYSNIYITVIPDWLDNFEMNPFWKFPDAIVEATVKPQG